MQGAVYLYFLDRYASTATEVQVGLRPFFCPQSSCRINKKEEIEMAQKNSGKFIYPEADDIEGSHIRDKRILNNYEFVLLEMLLKKAEENHADLVKIRELMISRVDDIQNR